METCARPRVREWQLRLGCLVSKVFSCPETTVRGRLAHRWSGSSVRPDPAGAWQRSSSQLLRVFVSLPCPVLADSQAWHPVVHLSFKLELTLTIWTGDCAMLVLCREQEEVRKK